MGKSKKRILKRGINDRFSTITRDEALVIVVQDFKFKSVSDKTKDMITLFGFSAEELLENGVQYEDVKTLEAILPFN